MVSLTDTKSEHGPVHHRWWVHLAWLVVAALVGAAAFWAARAFTAPAPGSEVAEAPVPTVVARAGEVGESLSVQGFVSFGEGVSVFSGRSGVVTALSVDPSTPIESGSQVATVDLAPVIVAEGATPAFRDMVEGVRGADVAQLQAFLGLAEADGVFGPGTRRAVVEWKRSLGIRNPDASVPLGMVVFVPSLPVRAVPAEGVVVGSSVSAGSALLVTLQERPVVSVHVDSAPRVQTGMPVSMTVTGEELTGRVGPVMVIDGLRRYVIEDEEGGGICDAQCGAGFPAEGESHVSLQVEVSPVVTGVMLPSAALGVHPDGSRAVRTPDGEIIAVDVAAEASGMAIVEGVEEGTEVLLFGDTP